MQDSSGYSPVLVALFQNEHDFNLRITATVPMSEYILGKAAEYADDLSFNGDMEDSVVESIRTIILNHGDTILVPYIFEFPCFRQLLKKRHIFTHVVDGVSLFERLSPINKQNVVSLARIMAGMCDRRTIIRLGREFEEQQSHEILARAVAAYGLTPAAATASVVAPVESTRYTPVFTPVDVDEVTGEIVLSQERMSHAIRTRVCNLFKIMSGVLMDGAECLLSPATDFTDAIEEPLSDLMKDVESTIRRTARIEHVVNVVKKWQKHEKRQKPTAKILQNMTSHRHNKVEVFMSRKTAKAQRWATGGGRR
jgi:hypothetical protein